jgi:hypothetical protein
MNKYSKPEDREQSLINDILENFDFIKCHEIMKLIGWTWHLNYETPTIDMLKKSAVDRLKNAMCEAKKGRCSKATYFSSSGGLKGNAWVNRYGHIEGIRLEFVLTDWDADGD